MTGPEALRSQRLVLMNPGPVVTDERVRAALVGVDLCHREPEFADVMTRVRARVTEISGGSEAHSSVVLTGSGTAAVEATITSAIPAHGSVLTIDNGHYGERMHDIAMVYGIPSHRLEFGWARPIDVQVVDAALERDRSLTHLAVVHHETSTGMLNDVGAVARIAHRHGREVIVDAVSSVGAEELSLERDCIDWLAGSANKCLEGMPGLAFVCAWRAAFEALANSPRRTYFLDLHRHYSAQEMAGSPAFTPGIPAFRAFDVALELARAEGVAARGQRYRSLAERLRAGLQRLGLRLLLTPEHRSSSLTAVHLPDGVPYARLHASLKRAGFVIYAAQGPLASTVFRLATMGQITVEDIESFLDALAQELTLSAPGDQAA